MTRTYYKKKEKMDAEKKMAINNWGRSKDSSSLGKSAERKSAKTERKSAETEKSEEN